jgi:hypothetical protein
VSAAYRLDPGRLLAVVDARCAELGWSRSGLARAMGATPSAFTRMAKGGTPDAHLLANLLMWLGWAPELLLLAEGDGPAVPVCGTCHGGPPAGFSCNRCGAVGVRS